MKFRTLCELKSLVVDEMIRNEEKMQKLNEEAETMKKEGRHYNSETDELLPEYEYNREQFRKYLKKHGDLQDILTEIDEAELK